MSTLKTIDCTTTVLDDVKIKLDQPIFSLEKPVEFNKGETIDSSSKNLHEIIARNLFRWPQISKIAFNSDCITINLIPGSERIIHGLAMDFNEKLSGILYDMRIGIPEFRLVTGN